MRYDRTTVSLDRHMNYIVAGQRCHATAAAIGGQREYRVGVRPCLREDRGMAGQDTRCRVDRQRRR